MVVIIKNESNSVRPIVSEMCIWTAVKDVVSEVGRLRIELLGWYYVEGVDMGVK